MKDRATPMQLAAAYVGCMIGAGFASGQEHLQFFLSFGREGFWGIAAAGTVLIAFGGIFLQFAFDHGTRSHKELLQAILPAPVAMLFDILMISFLLGSLAVMMAGGGALTERTGLAGKEIGVVLIALITFGVTALGSGRMLKINGGITILMALLLLLVGIKGWMNGGFETARWFTPLERGWVPKGWLTSAFLYASYNAVFAFSLFGALGDRIRRSKDGWVGGMLGGTALTILSVCVCLAVLSVFDRAVSLEIPILAAVASAGQTVRLAYTVTVFAAMLTTAIASAFSLVSRLSDWIPIPLPMLTFGVTVAAYPLAMTGFGTLVSTVYPLVGYVGAGCLLAAFYRWIREKGKTLTLG